MAKGQHDRKPPPLGPPAAPCPQRKWQPHTCCDPMNRCAADIQPAAPDGNQQIAAPGDQRQQGPDAQRPKLTRPAIQGGGWKRSGQRPA